jgi:hypothetical protein
LRIRKIIEEFSNPDLVYTDFYQFWHSGVAPWEPQEHLIDVKHGFFFVDRHQPFRLSAEDAARAVEGSLALRINFSFNSQAFLYSRGFLDRLRAKAPIYRSPFPDYYIANVAVAESEATVVVPDPMGVAGVSKASYGYAMYNDMQAKGDALLNVRYSDDPVYRDLEARLLPGSSYNTNFIVAMEYVARDTRGRIGKPADFQRYRQLQIVAALKGYYSGALRRSLWRDTWRRLSGPERLWAMRTHALLTAHKYLPSVRERVDRKLEVMSSMTGFSPMPRHCGRTMFNDVVGLYEAFEAGTIR